MPKRYREPEPTSVNDENADAHSLSSTRRVRGDGVPYEKRVALQQIKLSNPKTPMHSIASTLNLTLSGAQSAYKGIKRRWEEEPDLDPYDPKLFHDKPRFGRPKKLSTHEEMLLGKHCLETQNGNHKKRHVVIAAEHGIKASRTTIERTTKRRRIGRYTMRRKPFLSRLHKRNRKESIDEFQRLGWEFWKRIVWFDKTSINKEGYDNTHISISMDQHSTEQWKEFNRKATTKKDTNYQFYEAFTYDEKGSCNTWVPESEQQRKASYELLNAKNEKLRAEAEKTFAEVLEKRKRKGKVQDPAWVRQRIAWRKTDALVHSEGGGIDWFDHLYGWTIPHLIPFMKRLNKGREEGEMYVLMEDGSASHKSEYVLKILMRNGIMKIKWPGNSPDMNPIEKAWK
ncbi:hypothetical protein BJ508DRAFT_333402 [Ascobolus immersus RN42]|uniref:Tc1-like transposase DDE domain-containing protein n=1 Tax=Ascobolus immersus RN42 TaxID=1160509 RepID=A0A3N4HPY2_ASCIM|nr:hypothetical protein BJ508DRAFT_333402 [Ascobolus immersus RN42]